MRFLLPVLLLLPALAHADPLPPAWLREPNIAPSAQLVTTAAEREKLRLAVKKRLARLDVQLVEARDEARVLARGSAGRRLSDGARCGVPLAGDEARAAGFPGSTVVRVSLGCSGETCELVAEVGDARRFVTSLAKPLTLASVLGASARLAEDLAVRPSVPHALPPAGPAGAVAPGLKTSVLAQEGPWPVAPTLPIDAIAACYPGGLPAPVQLALTVDRQGKVTRCEPASAIAAPCACKALRATPMPSSGRLLLGLREDGAWPGATAETETVVLTRSQSSADRSVRLAVDERAIAECLVRGGHRQSLASLRAQVQVSAQGMATGASLDSSSTLGEPTRACVLDVLAHTPATCPQAGAPVVVEVSLQLQQRARHDAPATASDPEIFRSKLMALDACYQAALKKFPRLAGTILAVLQVRADGSVERVDVQSKFPAETVTCMQNELSQLQFVPRDADWQMTHPVGFGGKKP